MADEDEIDILGDFTLSNFSSEAGANILDPLVSQTSDLLNCDYTIHPQWLLDRPSGNPDNWYESTSTSSPADIFEADALGHVSTENCITDESGWTEKEKSLLHRGIEIFGKSSVRLSQFVGSKTASEVKYYLRNYFSENQILYRQEPDTVVTEPIENHVVSDVLDSDQIPASIEEVIAVVSTGTPTVTPYKKVRKKSISSNNGPSPPSKEVASSTSLSIKRKLTHLNTITHSRRNLLKSIQKLKNPKLSPGHKVKKKSLKVKFEIKPKLERVVSRPVPKKEVAKQVDLHHKVTPEITTGRGLSVPICEGEEIIKIENAEDDASDISIDIEDDDDLNQKEQKVIQEEKLVTDNQQSLPQVSSLLEEGCNDLQLNELDGKLAEELTTLEEPTVEVTLDEHNPTELEKFAHYEFFEGRPSKTPERYLKIRNHIINNWKNSKPSYINKTSMRLGLKNCGDVTCISRIHYFLEQIGAINFGCEQTKYERPLSETLHYSNPQKEKPNKKVKNVGPREFSELGPRQRIKKKFTNDGEGGYTLAHGDQGQIINTTIVNEEPPKQKMYLKKPSIRLIYCRPFTEENPQPYRVKISLSTLLLMDFHAHAYLTEVMGLVGGSWSSLENTLTITNYEPCKNIASSSTHCDMCPISQAKAAESIHNNNLDILGWFHSHPTFAPEPSQQDLETQQLVQQWIGHNKPCIGLILSPFSANGALIASPFRCLVVDKKPNFEDQLVPYRFRMEVMGDKFDVPIFLKQIKRILFVEDRYLKDKTLEFHKPYFQDLSITHLEKFISSVNMHLAKYGNLNKTTCDEILQGIKSILYKITC